MFGSMGSLVHKGSELRAQVGTEIHPAVPLVFFLSAQRCHSPTKPCTMRQQPLAGAGGEAFYNLHKGTIRANGGSEFTSPESPAIPVRPSTFKVKIEPIEILDGK